MKLVYWSSKSENTKSFLDKLNYPKIRLPLSGKDTILVQEPFILFTPSYGGGFKEGAVPKPVIYFLNQLQNRKHIKAVVGLGDRQYGKGFAIAADIISYKCQIPLLHKVEGVGTEQDVLHIQQYLKNQTNFSWKTISTKL